MQRGAWTLSDELPIETGGLGSYASKKHMKVIDQHIHLILPDVAVTSPLQHSNSYHFTFTGRVWKLGSFYSGFGSRNSPNTERSLSSVYPNPMCFLNALLK
ncbi:hypothetical protein F2P81_016239 [Scophthalmus maximus]|uniref:Uncharacterized protein n=1 Tax=Scophthalmus maximus TaxID=52904 RepID=A0A6A4SL01_SCOMX|nr:hypothetical protein F2P81_016239 [Scophthalmus maximus]